MRGRVEGGMGLDRESGRGGVAVCVCFWVSIVRTNDISDQPEKKGSLPSFPVLCIRAPLIKL